LAAALQIAVRFHHRVGIVTEENHPVGPQRVERILEFCESAVDVAEWRGPEVAESAQPFGDETRRVAVDAPRHLPPLRKHGVGGIVGSCARGTAAIHGQRLARSDG
jgi:hypothetical protein